EHTQIPLQKQRNLAGVSRPHDERERHRTMVVPGPDASSYAATEFFAKTRKFERRRPPGRAASDGGGLRPPAPSSNGLPGHLSGAGIAEISLLRSSPCVSEVDAHAGALVFVHLAA